MAFKITHRDNIEAEFRRIAVEQVNLVLAEIDGAGADLTEAVHSARKRCKRLRGLIRLVRPHFPDYRRENATIRDAAAALSATRDADVLFVTLHKILARMGGDARDVFAPVGDRLRAQSHTGADEPVQSKLKDFRAEMAALGRRAEVWRLKAKGFRALAPGMLDTYTQMRDAMGEARRTGDPEDFHEWRKGAKYHWHHLCLVRASAPEILSSARDVASDLAELLGDHHDLSVLAAALNGLEEGEGLPTLDPLAQAIKERMDELAGDAFRLGHQISAERPAGFRKRLRAYWKNWALDEEPA